MVKTYKKYMFHVLKYFLEFKELVFCKHFKDKSSHNNMIHVQITLYK